MTQEASVPSLFGLNHSNRDFSNSNSWGKNQFNSSFPAALSAFLEKQGFENVYLKLNSELKVYHGAISTTVLYGGNPLSNELFYAFESPFAPFQQLVTGTFPRVDLVTMHRTTNQCLQGLEIKLTAVPDNTTCHLSEDKYGSELVVRPDTIVYLGCSMAEHFKGDLPKLRNLIGDGFNAVGDWQDGTNISSAVCRMASAVDRIALAMIDSQEPLVMQPIWKTKGKSPELAENCLDVLVWSNLAFAQLFLDVARRELQIQKAITRQVRTAVWLFKMLYDFSIHGQIDHRTVIDSLSYDTRNDKAFAVSGMVSHPYMRCDVLAKPRITKGQIKEIILGGGQNLLSPERRFDAIVFNSPDLFQ